MSDPQALIQDALDHVRAAEDSLVAWQHDNPPLPPLPTETPRPCRDVMAILGVCTHLESAPYSTNVPKVIEAIKALRIKRVRCRIYNNNTAQREAFKKITAETGATFVSNLGQPGQAATPTKMVTWLETFPEGVVTAIEGNNEPNLQLGADWAAKTRQWMADLKAALSASSKAWVRALPLLAPALGKREGYETLGPIPQADYGNIHIYQGGDLADFRLDQGIKDEEACTGNKPVITTETGYHNAMNNTGTHIPTSEKAAGIYVPEIPLEHLLRGKSAGAYLYELVDNPANPDGTDQEAHFGLLRSDWSAKPSYNGLVKVSDAFADDGFAAPDLSPVQVKIEGPPDLQHILFAHSDGTYRMALWRRVSVWDKTAQKDLTVPAVAITATFAKTYTNVNQTKPPGAPVTGTLGAGVAVVAFSLT